MVVTSVVPVSATLGISSPLSIKLTSKPADAAGAEPEELIPTF